MQRLVQWSRVTAALRRHHEVVLAAAFVVMASYELLEMGTLEPARTSWASFLVHAVQVLAAVRAVRDGDSVLDPALLRSLAKPGPHDAVDRSGATPRRRPHAGRRRSRPAASRLGPPCWSIVKT